MYRTFQTAMTIHRPDVVFILGKLKNKIKTKNYFFNELFKNIDFRLSMYHFTIHFHIFNSQVLFLGDIFDEGLWSTPDEFNTYMNRFKSIFSVPYTTKLYVVSGNHDIGFHYGNSVLFKNVHKRAF